MRPSRRALIESRAVASLRLCLLRIERASTATQLALLATLVFGFLLRLWLIDEALPMVAGDARHYEFFARGLASGEGYAIEAGMYDPALDGLRYQAYRTPGYPFILYLAFSIFGWGYRTALALNLVAEVATQLVVVLLAVRLLSARAAVAASALFALHVLWTIHPMTESIATFLLASIALLLAYRAHTSFFGALGLGVVVALAIYVRPVLLSVLVVVVPTTWARGSLRTTLVRASGVLLPVIVAVAGWTTRNYLAFGELVPFSTNLGVHNARSFQLNWYELWSSARSQGLNEAQTDRALVRAELARVLAQPRWFVVDVLWPRLGELFDPAPVGELRHHHWVKMLADSPGGVWVQKTVLEGYLALYGAAAAGLALTRISRGSFAGLGYLAGAFVVLQTLLSTGNVRFLSPLVPLLCLFAAGLLNVALRARSAQSV